MKMKKRLLLGLLSLSGSVLTLGGLQGQTTLTGDHIITGDLNVGTTANKGNLTVTGETGNTAAPGIKVTGDGGVVFGGTYGTGQIPATGAGVRFMWYPKKAALRVGRGDDANWSDDNIGVDSVALGYFSYSLGQRCFSTSESSADGRASVALSGGVVEYTGFQSSAFSSGYAAFPLSTGMSGGIAFAELSVAMSCGMTGGEAATAMSNGDAEGILSTAVGQYSLSVGNYSVAIGQGTTAVSAWSIAVGANNIVRTGNPSNWVLGDTIFVIGNGTGVYSDPPEIRNSDALVVYKNGNITIPKRQGDVLMGEFGNPE